MAPLCPRQSPLAAAPSPLHPAPAPQPRLSAGQRSAGPPRAPPRPLARPAIGRAAGGAGTGPARRPRGVRRRGALPTGPAPRFSSARYRAVPPARHPRSPRPPSLVRAESARLPHSSCCCRPLCEPRRPVWETVTTGQEKKKKLSGGSPAEVGSDAKPPRVTACGACLLPQAAAARRGEPPEHTASFRAAGAPGCRLWNAALRLPRRPEDTTGNTGRKGQPGIAYSLFLFA